jgi:hypothetical protein
MGLNDGVPSHIPRMEVDTEDAVYDEETGALIMESALNHSSRYYVKPGRGAQDDGASVHSAGGGSTYSVILLFFLLFLFFDVSVSLLSIYYCLPAFSDTK